MEAAIAAWLDAKHGRSGSSRTLAAYRATMTAFRRRLQLAALDLDSPAPQVSAAAAAFAGCGRHGVRPATYNLRLAILSSFYQFAHRRQLLAVPNPIALVERRAVEPYAGARALDYSLVKKRLRAIDRREPAGCRDYAVLAVLLQTGRRAAEVAGLLRADVATESDGRLQIVFRRCKGGKQMEDLLPPAASEAVRSWILVLTTLPTTTSGALENNAPLWVSLAGNGTGGRALSTAAIGQICLRRLCTSRVHACRHTFARAMEDAGAKVSEIQSRLGHSSLQTTGLYLHALHRADNDHAAAVGSLLGLE